MPAEGWRFEDFELNAGAYELRRSGQAVRLERIPFELLCFLVERRGELVTREEIIERVWGKGVFIDSENGINTAVRKIRRALDDDADAPRFVVTVPARGYRFVASIREAETVAAKEPFAAAHPMAGTPEQTVQRYWPKSALSIAGLLILVAAVVAVRHLSLRAPAPSASIPRAEKPALTALPLPAKPSIAVLPFANMSGDPQQEYFSDGITDELITALSRLPDLFVIARTSSFIYKGKAAKVQDVSRELGVRYVLEGSVRKSGGTVRVTAQLVDAASGDHLWAEQYDRPLRDIFALQDEIVRRIVTTLKLQLSLWDKYGLLVTKRTDNPEAYDYYLRGLAHCYSNASRAGNEQARRLYQKAIEVDPNYSEAFASLGFTYLLEWAWRWSQEDHDLDRALELEQHAVALDESQSFAHALLGATYLFKRQHEQALAEGQRAIDLDPNFAPAYSWMAETLTFSGKPAKAIVLVEKAMRLDPRNQGGYLLEIARAYNETGRYAEAVPVLKRHLTRYPNSLPGHASLAIAYAELGREVEARAEGAEVLRISPNFFIGYEKMNPDIDRALANRRLADLRKAGLK